MDKPITFNEWLGTQGNMVLLHANCCRIAFEGGQQSMQSKVEELQKQLSEYIFVSETLDEMYVKEAQKSDELQKRVDALELKLREIAGIARRARHGEYYTESGRNAGLNIAAEIEQALKGECRHESDGINRLSLPPKTKCKKCGEFYSAHELKDGDQ